MTFILYRNGTCLTKIDKLLFHNHFKILKNEIKKYQCNEQDFFTFP